MSITQHSTIKSIKNVYYARKKYKLKFVILNARRNLSGKPVLPVQIK